MGHVNCCKCGITFGMPDDYINHRREDHQSFYCPNGHSQAFLKESETEKLRRERDILAQRIARKDDEIAARDKQIVAANGQITKMKKRAEKGVCPCCNRQFKDMHAHMKTKHPDFNANVIDLATAKKRA